MKSSILTFLRGPNGVCKHPVLWKVNILAACSIYLSNIKYTSVLFSPPFTSVLHLFLYCRKLLHSVSEVLSRARVWHEDDAVCPMCSLGTSQVWRTHGLASRCVFACLCVWLYLNPFLSVLQLYSSDDYKSATCGDFSKSWRPVGILFLKHLQRFTSSLRFQTPCKTYVLSQQDPVRGKKHKSCD